MPIEDRKKQYSHLRQCLLAAITKNQTKDEQFFFRQSADDGSTVNNTIKFEITALLQDITHPWPHRFAAMLWLFAEKKIELSSLDNFVFSDNILQPDYIDCFGESLPKKAWNLFLTKYCSVKNKSSEEHGKRLKTIIKYVPAKFLPNILEYLLSSEGKKVPRDDIIRALSKRIPEMSAGELRLLGSYLTFPFDKNRASAVSLSEEETSSEKTAVILYTHICQLMVNDPRSPYNKPLVKILNNINKSYSEQQKAEIESLFQQFIRFLGNKERISEFLLYLVDNIIPFINPSELLKLLNLDALYESFLDNQNRGANRIHVAQLKGLIFKILAQLNGRAGLSFTCLPIYIKKFYEEESYRKLAMELFASSYCYFTKIQINELFPILYRGLSDKDYEISHQSVLILTKTCKDLSPDNLDVFINSFFNNSSLWLNVKKRELSMRLLQNIFSLFPEDRQKIFALEIHKCLELESGAMKFYVEQMALLSELFQLAISNLNHNFKFINTLIAKKMQDLNELNSQFAERINKLSKDLKDRQVSPIQANYFISNIPTELALWDGCITKIETALYALSALYNLASEELKNIYRNVFYIYAESSVTSIKLTAIAQLLHIGAYDNIDKQLLAQIADLHLENCYHDLQAKVFAELLNKHLDSLHYPQEKVAIINYYCKHYVDKIRLQAIKSLVAVIDAFGDEELRVPCEYLLKLQEDRAIIIPIIYRMLEQRPASILPLIIPKLYNIYLDGRTHGRALGAMPYDLESFFMPIVKNIAKVSPRDLVVIVNLLEKNLNHHVLAMRSFSFRLLSSLMMQKMTHLISQNQQIGDLQIKSSFEMKLYNQLKSLWTFYLQKQRDEEPQPMMEYEQTANEIGLQT